MHVYTFDVHLRQPHLLKLHKMVENYNVENLYNLVIKSLKEVANMNNIEITTKLICVGADGIAIMQGYRNGLCVLPKK